MDIPESDFFYSGHQFQQFFKGSCQSLILKANTPHFTILAVSDNYLQLTHKKREEILDKNLFEVFPGSHSDPDEQFSVFSSFTRVIDSKHRDELPVFKYEIFVSESGKNDTFYWSNVNEPILDEAGKVTYIINTTANITTQVLQQQALVEAEENILGLQKNQALHDEIAAANEELIATNLELQHTQETLQLLNEELEERVFQRTSQLSESERRFRTMAEDTEILIAVADQSSNGVYFNKAWQELTGKSMEDLLEFGWADLIHPDDKDRWIREYMAAFEKQISVQGEFRILSQQGEYRYLLANIPARFNPDGSFAGYISSCIDITERKKIEEEKQNNVIALETANAKLEEVADSLKLALESAEMGTWKADIVSDILTISEEARTIHGIPENFTINFTKTAELIDIQYRDRTLLAIEHAVKTRAKFVAEYLIHPMDGGSSKWIRSTGKAFYDEFGSPVYVLGTILDITTQKNKEEVLKYRKALLEAQNEAIPDALLIVGTDGQMLSYNQHFIDLWRIPGEIAQSKDDSAALQFAMTQLLDPQGFIDRVKYCYAHPNEAAHEDVLFKDGRVIERFGNSVKSEDGTSYGWAWYFRDITKQRQLQKQKDEFISTVSHELKTPVTSIKAYAQLLHRSVKEERNTEEQKSFLERMNVQIAHLESLIKDLLDISRIEAGKFSLKEEEFDISEVIQSLISDLQIITPWHTLEVEKNHSVNITTDRNRIIQVITNLVTNAVKYSPGSEIVKICSEISGNSLIFSVTDFGIGIAEHQKKYLFERFHQIERTNTGTGFNLGLGLYISKEIITHAGGAIWVDSEPGKGSTFSFSLPLA
jgi:PAS domain S-box-containing protein